MAQPNTPNGDAEQEEPISPPPVPPTLVDEGQRAIVDSDADPRTDRPSSDELRKEVLRQTRVIAEATEALSRAAQMTEEEMEAAARKKAEEEARRRAELDSQVGRHKKRGKK